MLSRQKSSGDPPQEVSSFFWLVHQQIQTKFSKKNEKKSLKIVSEFGSDLAKISRHPLKTPSGGSLGGLSTISTSLLVHTVANRRTCIKWLWYARDAKKFAAIMIEFAYRTIGQFNLANHWIEFCTGTSAVGKKKTAVLS